VRSWASQVQALTCSQLGAILQLAGAQGQLRASVIVALWTKVLDRTNLVKVRRHCRGHRGLRAGPGGRNCSQLGAILRLAGTQMQLRAGFCGTVGQLLDQTISSRFS
jgi:hypothetical protein